MKILLITQNYSPNKGGMAVSCDRLVRNFKKNGVEVHVVHFTNRKKKFKVDTVVKGTYAAVPIESSEEFTLSLASEFIQQLPCLDTLTHVGVFGGNLPLNIGPILSKWIQKPLITFIRGNDFDEGIFSKKRNQLLYALENSRYVFTVTSEKREKIDKLVSHNNTYFTQNGINTALWKPAKSHLKRIDAIKKAFNSKIPIAFVGQLKAKKGVVNFVETFAKFPHKNDFVLCLIGDVNDETKTYILNLDVNVEFYDFANQNELITFYNAVGIVAIPSYYDGMPNVLLEAAATKNIVIGANVGGIKDVISNKADGFLYNPIQSNELLDILLQVHKMTPAEKEAMSEALYQKIKTNYTEEIEITNYLNILKP
ncbi:glycosyltransferase [Maribacter sp. SA7]|uniref:glycosyltransferase family 4 protein n=1 Tax=Maribacter zhoushanensis TaxID=3030012 RepID=UPI0023ED2DE4|nr:glycosyltransferase [Maribacter zhoushanensis]MDF4202904.1 glycosyltransferase [Maribacter zhoushanensis]